MTMTAKYLDHKDGRELVVECDRVIAQKANPSDRHPCKITIVEPDGRLEVYYSGKVYLMNDTGATVSQWFIEYNPEFK